MGGKNMFLSYIEVIAIPTPVSLIYKFLKQISAHPLSPIFWEYDMDIPQS